MSVTDPNILARLNRARTAKKKPEPKGPSKSKRPEKENKQDLEQWFLDGDKQATGKCRHCGGRTCKGDPLFYKHSQAHILPKRLFPSVATHPLNRVELCFWENNCHGNFDNGTLDLMDMNCFDEIIEKFIAIYPEIVPAERKHIPDVLLQYLKDNL